MMLYVYNLPYFRQTFHCRLALQSCSKLQIIISVLAILRVNLVCISSILNKLMLFKKKVIYVRYLYYLKKQSKWLTTSIKGYSKYIWVNT